MHDKTDNDIIDLFLSRDEKAIELTEKRYGKYLQTIAENVLCDRQDSLECVNDTYLSVWNHIPPDKPECFKAYISSIVRNIAISRYREKSSHKHIPSEYLSSLQELEDHLQSKFTTSGEYENIELNGILNGFVKSLPRRQRYIFICRYYYFDTIPVIAKSLKVSESTISKNIAEIKQKLMNTLIKEGYYEYRQNN